jgi:hypothetical protein
MRVLVREKKKVCGGAGLGGGRGERKRRGGGESRIFLKWYIERWVCIGPESSEWTEVKEEEEEEEEEGGGLLHGEELVEIEHREVPIHLCQWDVATNQPTSRQPIKRPGTPNHTTMHLLFTTPIIICCCRHCITSLFLSF